MRIHRGAAIDIGSNTTLYLLGDLKPDQTIKILDENTISNNIGRDVFQHGFITEETIQQNMRIISDLVAKAESGSAEKILIAGTSALRQAVNRIDFIERIRNKFNLELKIIDGPEEAALSYRGYKTSEKSIIDNLTLFDIGGGSTEKIRIMEGEVIESGSYELGAVRLHRMFHLGDPPIKCAFDQMEQYLENTILTKKIVLKKPIDNLVFSGGTATCLAALYLGIDEYSPDIVEGVILDRIWIERILGEFIKVDLHARKKLLFFDPDRAEVIIGGTLLMVKIMQLIGQDGCSITHRGLRFGLLASAFK